MTLNFRIENDVTVMSFAIGTHLEKKAIFINFIYWSFIVQKIKNVNNIEVKL